MRPPEGTVQSFSHLLTKGELYSQNKKKRCLIISIAVWEWRFYKIDNILTHPLHFSRQLEEDKGNAES